MINVKSQVVARPLHSPFRIARGVKTEAVTIVVTLEYEGHIGRGEAVPYARYGETAENEIAKLDNISILHIDDDPRQFLKAGAARNALDCALWDLSAKLTDMPAHLCANIAIPDFVRTAETLSLDTPENMAAAAAKLSEDALIKVKLGGAGDVERLTAIRQVRPYARIIVDANEGWSHEDYKNFVPAFLRLRVEMIEQPFPADNDQILAHIERPIRICADESAHVAKDVQKLADRYDMINIKLDKTGGLSEAIDMMQAAQKCKMPYMIGCMVGSSLGMAPAFVLSKNARYVDLDGPLFLRDDEEPKIQYRDGIMHKPSRQLWG